MIAVNTEEKTVSVRGDGQQEVSYDRLVIPCNTVFYKCTVTNGVNIRKVRPLKLICNNQSPLHRKSRIRKEVRGRADAHGKDHQLRRQIPLIRIPIFL